MEPGPKPEDQVYIFRPWITLRNGKRLYAYQVGLKAFKIPVKGKPRDDKVK
jgi:hypothetical protein